MLPQEWIVESLRAAGVWTSRRRRLPCAMTVWLVLLLALFRRLSYRNLLGMLEGSRWVLRHWRGRPPPSSTALSKARDRVGVAPLAHLYRRSARAWEEAGGGLWFHGRRVHAIDGFNLKTWDSDAHRSSFGAPGASRGASAFPQVRVVGCLDVGTRMLTADDLPAKPQLADPHQNRTIVPGTVRSYFADVLARTATATARELLPRAWKAARDAAQAAGLQA